MRKVPNGVCIQCSIKVEPKRSTPIIVELVWIAIIHLSGQIGFAINECH